MCGFWAVAAKKAIPNGPLMLPSSAALGFSANGVGSVLIGAPLYSGVGEAALDHQRVQAVLLRIVHVSAELAGAFHPLAGSARP